MKVLTNNELMAVAISMYGIRYPDTEEKFILEVYYGVFFKGLAEELEVNRETLRQKLEHMQKQCPQEFSFLMDKMKDCWDKDYKKEDLLIRLSELGLTGTTESLSI